ncbi:MAG: sulfotransferase [Myxococcota bacterium]|nr:sulfotransferase [Myxococcota bacterium]
MATESRETAFAAGAGPTPLFIFGVARSGTTYTYTLLNEHPQIRLTYEGCIVKEGDYYYRRRRDLSDRGQFDQLMEELCEIESLSERNRWVLDTIRANGDALFRRHRAVRSFGDLVEHIHMLPGEVGCWGSKLLRVEMIPELLRHLPMSKFVILIRDPRAVFSSQVAITKFRPRYSAIYWNLHSALTRQLYADADRYLVIRYEDLVRDLPGALEKIFRFGGVWDTKVADDVAAAWPAMPESLGKWKQELDAQQVRIIEDYCFDEMQKWGYEPVYASRQRSMGRLTMAAETVLQNLRLMPWDLDYWRRKQILKRFLISIRG